jgi:hypothetical protein
MSVRLRAARLWPLVVVLFGATPAGADPAAIPTVPTPFAASPALWPYPHGCLETAVDWFNGFWDAEQNLAHVSALRGSSRPCAGTTPTRGVRLAITQYQIVAGRTVGWMGSPWQTNSTGSLRWSRTGKLPLRFAVLCLSTGLQRRHGAVYAQHSRCIRPVPDEDSGWLEGVEVPVDDPRVSVPLGRWPAPGDNAPPGCANCFVTDPTAALPEPDPTSEGPTAARCARLSLDTATLDQWRDINLVGTVRSCVPGQTTELYLNTVRYSADVGDLGRPWWEILEEPNVQPFDKAGALAVDVRAICIINGIDQTDDGLRGHHLLCLGVERNAVGVRRLVRIPVTDHRVTRPVDTLDDGAPIGPCPSCL